MERALERADIDDDVKTAIDVSKLLLPLEDQLRKREEERGQVDQYPGIDDMPRSALELLQEFDERVAAGGALSEYEQGQVDVLVMASRGQILLAGELIADPPPPVAIDVPALAAEAPEQSRPEPEPEPVPTCEYCRQRFARCAELKAADLGSWRTLHWRDPSEVARRSEESTQIMLAQMRHAHRRWGL